MTLAIWVAAVAIGALSGLAFALAHTARERQNEIRVTRIHLAEIHEQRERVVAGAESARRDARDAWQRHGDAVRRAENAETALRDRIQLTLEEARVVADGLREVLSEALRHREPIDDRAADLAAATSAYAKLNNTGTLDGAPILFNLQR